MNLQISMLGYASGNGGGGYDDTSIKQELAGVKQKVESLLATRKEYQAAYVAAADFSAPLANNTYTTVKFAKPFSKVPMVKAVLDVRDTSVRVMYQANATTTGFDIGLNYASSLNGVWYEAYIID